VDSEVSVVNTYSLISDLSGITVPTL